MYFMNGLGLEHNFFNVYLLKGNCFLHHSTAPNHGEKPKIPLKKGVHIKLHSGPPFPEHNNLFRINFSGLFSVSDFFIRNGILIFFFRIFISKTHKSLPDFFFQNALFSILDFYFQNKEYFWNFWNYVGCRFKSIECREHLPY